MTLPNSYLSTKRKLSKIWEQTQSNRIRVNIQEDEQNVIIKELNKTVIRTFDNNQIIDLTTEYVIPQIANYDNDVIYQNWEFEIIGLKFAEMVGYRANLLVKFGAGNTIINDFIRPESISTNARSLIINNYISTDSTVDSRQNILKLHFGFYLQDFNGLPEFNTQEMKVAVHLVFINPRYYN